MGKFRLSWDSSESFFGTLTSTDLLLNSLMVECVALTAIARSEMSSRPLLPIYSEDHGADVLQIEWTNPLDIVAMIKSVTQVPVDWVLERTLFYKQELSRRELANQKAHQEVIGAKLENINRLIDVRAKALATGIDPENAIKVISEVANDMRIELKSADADGQALFAESIG